MACVRLIDGDTIPEHLRPHVEANRAAEAALFGGKAAKHRDDVFEQVAAVFEDAEIVELTMLCAFRNMRNRFHDTLDIDIDPPAGAARVASGLQVAPDNLRAYLQALLDNWPDEFPEQPAE